jgi:hypothetical protein
VRSKPYVSLGAATIVLAAVAACSSGSNKDDAAPPGNPGTPSGPGAVASSGSSGGSSAASNLPDPCTLVSKADFQAITGSAATEVKPTQLTGATECDFKSAGKESLGLVVEPGFNFQQSLDGYINVSGGTQKAEPLSGIGDHAALVTSGSSIGTDTTLLFQKGSVLVLLTSDSGKDIPTSQSQAKAFAGKAVARL